MMLSADEVPIIPTGSKPDDGIGLSSSAFPDARLSILLTPFATRETARGGSPPVQHAPHRQPSSRAAGAIG